MMNDKDGFKDAGALVASGVIGSCTWEVSGEPGEYTLAIDGGGDTSGNGRGWGEWRDGIKTVIIRGGMAGIDGRDFEG
jgi:hypothetical protein